MTLALTHPTLLAYLIAVDNAPVESPLNHDFWTYMQGMTAIDTGHYTSRKDVDRVFSTYVSDPLVRHFLLANLTRVPSPDGPYRFQFPVLTLRKALVRLGKFPFHDPEATHFDKPALFIRGTRSHYVSDKVLPLTRRFFPNMQLVDIDCGHWVISEKPQPFMEGKFKSLLSPFPPFPCPSLSFPSLPRLVENSQDHPPTQPSKRSSESRSQNHLSKNKALRLLNVKAVVSLFRRYGGDIIF